MEKKQLTGKRPLALPITLLLLVMSVMGNVLLYTKNIEHSRGQSQAEGLAIFTHFEKGREELAFWSGLVDEAAASPAADNGSGRMASAYLADSIGRGEGEIGALLLKAEELDESTFAGALEDYASYIEQYRETLAAIGTGNGPLSVPEREELAAVKSAFAELDGLLAEFHFAGADNQNVLIRLSGGHDWLPIAEKLQSAVQK